MTITRRQLVQAFGASAALGALHPFAAHAQVDQVKVYFGFPAGSSPDRIISRSCSWALMTWEWLSASEAAGASWGLMGLCLDGMA